MLPKASDAVFQIEDDVTGLVFQVRVEEIHGQEAVRVYDMRWTESFGSQGQPVSWLPLGTVYKQAYRNAGWMMVASERNWHLSAGSMRKIADWLLVVTG